MIQVTQKVRNIIQLVIEYQAAAEGDSKAPLPDIDEELDNATLEEQYAFYIHMMSQFYNDSLDELDALAMEIHGYDIAERVRGVGMVLTFLTRLSAPIKKLEIS